MRRLLPYLKPYWKGTLFGSLCKLLEAAMELMLPFYMAKLIDQGLNGGNQAVIFEMARNMLICTLIGLVAVMICQYTAAGVSTRFAMDVRNALMERISTFTYAEVDKFGTDTLTTRLTNDVNLVGNAVSMLIRLVTRAPFLSIGAIVMGTIVCPELAWAFIIIIPVFSIIIGIVMVKSVPLFKNVQERLDHMGLLIRENLSGIRVIRALNRQNAETKRVNDSADNLSKAYIRVTDITSWVNPFVLFLLNTVAAAVMWYGGLYIQDGTILLGDVTAFVEYIVQITAALVIIANLVTLFTKAAASANRISEVLDTNPAFSYGEKSAPKVKKNEDLLAVRCEDVTFTYGDGEAVLEHIDFSLPIGSTLGIIGPTGAGKSSLIYLISRFYETEQGKIQLFGENVSKYTREALTQMVGITPQKSTLFSGTIAENLKYGKEDATEEEVRQALSTAQALDFVEELPDGIHSVVKQGGQNFSGGQRQRLCIARTLVKKAPILILDDSLSALDYRTDAKLREALRKDQAGITTIIVSQRVSSVQSADQILVLEEGKMTGLGSHESLLKNCPTYAEIYHTQTALEGEEIL